MSGFSIKYPFFIIVATLVQIRIWNCEEEKAEHLIA